MPVMVCSRPTVFSMGNCSKRIHFEGKIGDLEKAEKVKYWTLPRNNEPLKF